VARLSLNRIDQLQVLALDIRKRLRIVLARRRVPIPLVKVLLKPRRTVETLTVNRLDLRRQHRPLSVCMRPQFFPGQRPIDVKAHVSGLNCFVLLRFGDANHVKVATLSVIQS